MQKKKVIALTGILLVLGVLTAFKLAKKAPEEKSPEVHYHAGFVVFDNGKKIDFSDIKYMHIETCAVEGVEEKEDNSPAHEQIEKAHLHDSIGDVVHVHRVGAKWSDLFTNIGYPVEFSKVTAYINGKPVDNLKDYPINNYDSAVIFTDSVDTKFLTQAVTVDRIKAVESRSETCGN